MAITNIGDVEDIQGSVKAISACVFFFDQWVYLAPGNKR